MNILGISAFYHDSAAALIKDGEIVAAAQEERFTRIKHDPKFPENAVKFCLKSSTLSWSEVDAVVFYDKPWLKFERIIETYYSVAPSGFSSFSSGIPIWIKEKAFMTRLLLQFIPKTVPIKFSNHHLSHGASAFYPSPFSSAAILTMDGVGEWATTTISHGYDTQFKTLREIRFPHSIGLLYSAFTRYCGFKVNSGEYKLMGLAPYGRKSSQAVHDYKTRIKNELCHIYDDGGIWLNQSYFDYLTGLDMVKTKKWEQLFGFAPRTEHMPLEQHFCDLALAIQEITEEVVLKLAQTAKSITGEKNLCLAGGVALNCVANSAIKRSGLFDEIWVQPASGDAGGALGAALAYYYSFKNPRTVLSTDSMKGSFLGPEFSSSEILERLNFYKVNFSNLEDSQLCERVAQLLNEGQIVGWFRGKMEFGPRALGARSILADPRNPEMQKRLNLKIKYREGFRPFAPSVLFEDSKTYFSEGYDSPYMLLIDHVKNSLQNKKPSNYDDWKLNDKLYFNRSSLPSITHLDYSARVQTVNTGTNPIYHKLIEAFKSITGVGMLVNTSFNVRGEPVVGSPEDALRCFFNTEMDALALGEFLIEKKHQKNETIEYFKKSYTSFTPD